MGWIVYAVAVLGAAGIVGWHLGRFQETFTEMTGMMLGMTMGMLNGFALGFAAGAATGSMFWGNAFGIFFGLLLGAFFGRAGGLMGVMDGGMGGLMGGAMGAMLAVMVHFPEWTLNWTGALLAVLDLGGMALLVLLVERRAPDLAEYHRLAPLFARWEQPIEEEDDPDFAEEPAAGAALVNYYELFDIPVRARSAAVVAAYQTVVASADPATRAVAVRALGTLSDPAARARYDRELAVASGRAECCPPPRRSSSALPLPTRGVGTGAPAASLPTRPMGATRAVRPAVSRPTTPARPGFDLRWGLLAVAVPVIVIAGVLLLGGAGSASTSGGRGGNLGAPSAALLAQAMLPAVGPDGVQALALAVNGDTRSYRPSVFKVQQGHRVRITLSVEGSDPGCGRTVAVHGLGASGVATPGQVSSFEFTPNQAGTYEINCNMYMMQPGYLIVTN